MPVHDHSTMMCLCIRKTQKKRSVTLCDNLKVQVSNRLGLLLRIAAPVVAEDKPNIVIIWGDDIGQSNISAYTKGLMGYQTPNIDRVANEGVLFTDYYAEQSCTAGRASFITGQAGLRTGLTKVGLPGADLGLKMRDVTIAELLKAHGYATGQFGKNHLGEQADGAPADQSRV